MLMDNRPTHHKFDGYDFNIVEDYTRAIVRLEHPDDGSGYYVIAVSSPEIPFWGDDEEWDRYYIGIYTTYIYYFFVYIIQ